MKISGGIAIAFQICMLVCMLKSDVLYVNLEISKAFKIIHIEYSISKPLQLNNAINKACSFANLLLIIYKIRRKKTE